MPDPLIMPLTEPDAHRRLETCTRGFSDRFGDRLLTFDRSTATPLELLRFKPELSGSSAFESGLRDRVERTQVQRAAVASARSVERWDGALVLVSRHAAGRRLSEMLAEGRGPATALDVLRQMTPALAALAEANGRFGHGALALDRVVSAHDGRLVVVEHPLGTAVESLGWPSARLQSELGLAVPPATKPMGFDSRIDPIQLGFVTLSLLLGRRLDAAEYPGGIARLLDESAEAKGGDSWAASRLRTWLERALQVGPRPFETASDALSALGELPTDADFARKERPPQAPPPVVLTAVPRPMIVPPPAKPVPVAIKPAPTPAPALVSPPPEPIGPIAAPARVVTKARPRVAVLPWAFAAVSAVALAEAVVIAGRWYFSPAPPAVVQPATPAAAYVAPAVRPAPRAERSQPDPPARAADPPSVATGAAPRFGAMTFTSPLELQVFEGGKRIGSSGGPIAILEGVHSVELVNEPLGFRSRETVTVRSGELATRAIAVPNGQLSLNAIPWADVWIDGNSAGQTPLANLSVAIGEHQITFRHPQFGEQRQAAVVKAEGVTRVSVTLQR